MDYNNSSSTSQQQQVQDEIIQLKEDLEDYDLLIRAAFDDNKLVEAYKRFCKRKIQKAHRDIEDNDEFYEHYKNELEGYQAKLEKDKNGNIQERDKLKKGKYYYYCMII